MKTEWNLKLFYTSRKSAAIRKDLEKARKHILAFEKKYKGKSGHLKSDSKLAKALDDYEALSADPSASRVLHYYLYLKELDSSDNDAIAKISKLEDEFTKLENRTLFFTLTLGKIERKFQRQFENSQKLKKYHYFLKRVFKESKYDLTEPEEKVLNLKSHTSYSLWVDGVEKAVSTQVVKHRGKVLPIAEAMGKVPSLPTKDRHALSDAIMERFRSIGDFAESELNAVVLHKKTNDELRGYKHPYSGTIIGYENDEESVLALVDTVTRMYSVSHRFFAVKSRLLGLKKLRYADRAAVIGENKKKISFRDACALYREVLAGVDDEYVRIFDSFLKEGHLDVYPKKGKAGGAYCASETGLPTMVLLNHTDDFRSFTTLAHEMGHAIHAEMSKRQSPIYQGHSTSVAETASTLFEQLAFDTIFETLNEREQVVALHDKISDDISSVFRQVAFFNFEQDLHSRIRTEGFLSKENIAKLLNTHMKAYLGPRFTLTDLDGYFFVTVSHFRRFFYVYSYAYGQIISRSMAERFKEDRTFGKEIKQFLSAGRSMSPEDIFNGIGINTMKPDFFKQGIEGVLKDIKKLEKLVSKKY